MKFSRLSLFTALILLSPMNHNAIAEELLNIRPVCETPEAVVPSLEIWRNQDEDIFWRLKEIRRLGCDLVLRHVIKLSDGELGVRGVDEIDVLRCGIRGPTPEQEYGLQFFYPITVDPELPYQVCEIEATFSYQGKLRYYTSYVNIRWRGSKATHTPPTKRGAVEN